MARQNGYELILLKPAMIWRLEKWGQGIQTFNHQSDAELILDQLLARGEEDKPTWLLVSDLRPGDVIYLYECTYTFVQREKRSCLFTVRSAVPVIERKLISTRGMIWTGDLGRPEAPTTPVGMTMITLPEEVINAISTFADHSFEDEESWGFNIKWLTDAQEVLEDWAVDPYAKLREEK